MSYICDCHNDSILRIGYGEYGSLVSTYNVSSERRFLQIFAMFVENGSGHLRDLLADNYGLESTDLYGGVLKLCEIYADKTRGDFSRCSNFKEIKTAVSKGESIGMLGLEGAGMIDDLGKLHEIFEKGVRFITLTWNFSNCIASGCSVSGSDEDRGLTDYGKEFVRECGRLGIAVDISHASLKTMEDVLSEAAGPILATHSNFRTVCDHVRNLPDDIAEGLVKKGGFIGLNTCLPFVRSGVTPENYLPEMLFDHLDYAIKKGWEKNLGFGFDIDGIDDYPKGITFDKSIHDQYVELLNQTGNYSWEVIEGLCCANFMRFLEEFF